MNRNKALSFPPVLLLAALSLASCSGPKTTCTVNCGGSGNGSVAVTMVADTTRIRATLDWTPQYDDLETIAAHALKWEEKLFRERHGDLQQAASA